MAVALLILMVAMALTVDSFSWHHPVGVRQLPSQIDTLNSKIALLDQRVFFTATFPSNVLTVGVGTVVFNQVLMNTGGGYNPTTGVFTAPCRGLYVFLVQMFTRGNGHANWDLYVNGHMVLRWESNTLDNSSHEYVYPVTLQAGDRVSVYSRNSLSIYGTNHSFFGGWLIKAL